ncbi:MAG: 2Fe-2S iron-sulfur cluster-binding protein, partial [Chloroflexota bacterium]|nr:2Fe-2S iron-sulfur cluster-binding protein [Chloroflexota bacterium]
MQGDTITLTINEREVTAPKGASVLEAARGVGIYIPTLCFHKEIKPFGACRICAVEIKGMRGLPTSCTTPATQGMVVQTETEAVRKQRRNILELLLTEHPHACLTCWRVDICDPYDICLRNAGVEERCSLCIKNKRCELQEICFKEKFPALRFPYQYRDIPVHQN